MGWLKRNLFFAIGVAVAFGLLGAAGYYDYASWSRNQAALTSLNGVYNNLSDLIKQKPSPGNGQVDNVAAAKDQDRQLRQWIDQTKNYFQPIAPIPAPAGGPLSSELFAGALHRTIAQLQHEAAVANVALPPDYDFSFTAHKDRLTFAPGSLDPLSVQLGEVKTISEILYGVGINALDGIQRVVVSPDDASGPQADYDLIDQPVTNDLAVLVPYQITFRAFSPEIAQTLKAFASSPNAFIVKTISVQPAGASGASATSAASPYGSVDAAAPAPPSTPAPSASMPNKGGWQTVLNEQLLRVTLTVELVKLTPRN
jgi:hypothetical protein